MWPIVATHLILWIAIAHAEFRCEKAKTHRSFRRATIIIHFFEYFAWRLRAAAQRQPTAMFARRRRSWTLIIRDAGEFFARTTTTSCAQQSAHAVIQATGAILREW